MAVVFTVFAVALLSAFLRPEGRADRFTRTRELMRRGSEAGRTLLSYGTDAVDWLSAGLARESQAGCLDDLLGPAEPGPLDQTAE